MKTKKSGKVEAIVVEQAATAAKSLSKSPSAVAPKVVLKKPKTEPQAAEQSKAVKAAKASKAAKKPKPKVVRDSFTMPQSEYQKIAEIKESCLKAGLQVKKSEVLRAGLQALCAMDAAQMKNALICLDKIKTGRPNKN